MSDAQNLEETLSFRISFVVPTRNNPEELHFTLGTLSREAPDDAEVIVVDSSDCPVRLEEILSVLGGGRSLSLIRRDPRGVFDGLNRGVEVSRGAWIATITAGDGLAAGAKSLFYFLDTADVDAFVFAQYVMGPSRNILYAFFPTHDSVWPHQSVILRRSVYERLGLYRTEYRYCADQQFMVAVRNSVPYRILSDVLTTFCLGGLSSGVSLQHSREIYLVRRKLGQGRTKSFLRAYLSPYLRWMAEMVLGYERIARIRHMIFDFYRRSVARD